MNRIAYWLGIVWWFVVVVQAEREIYRGFYAKRHSLPYIVSIRRVRESNGRRVNYGFCGGTVISRRYVITSRHCTDDFRKDGVSSFRVAVLAHTQTDGNFIRIHRYWRDREYGDYINDIAILELTRDAGVPPAKLAYSPRFMSHGKMGLIAGWGIMDADYNKQAYPPVLRVADVRIYGLNQCRDRYRRTYRYRLAREAKLNGDPVPPESIPTNNYPIQTEIFSDMVCAVGDDGAGIRPGDSGGPLLVFQQSAPVVVGVSSRITTVNRGNWHEDLPGQFSRVSFNRAFIDRHARGHQWV